MVSDLERSPVGAKLLDSRTTGLSEVAMIHATVTIVARRSQRKGVLEALRWLLASTAWEAGCLRRHLYENVEKKGSFMYVEEWATPADVQRRLRSQSYLRLLQIMELSAEPPEVRFLEVTGTMGMEAIHAARDC